MTSPFLFEAGCMLVGAVVVARWASIGPDQPTAPGRSRERGLLRATLRIPGVALMGVTSAVLIVIQTGVLVFLFPLYLVKRAGIGPEAIGLVVSLSVLGRLIALWFGGSVSDRWGRIRVLIPGLIIYAGLLASMWWLTQPAALSVVSVALGAAAGFIASIPTALASDQVDPSLQGITIAWIRTASDSGQIAGPLIMGALADAIDLSAPFLFGAALLGVTAWQCCRRVNVLATPVAASGRDS